MMPRPPGIGKGFWSYVEANILNEDIQLFNGSQDDFLKKAKESGDTRQYQKINTIVFPESKLEAVRKEYSGIESMEGFMRVYASSLPEVRESKEKPRAVVNYQIKEKSRFLGLVKDKLFEITVLSPKQVQ